MTCMHWEAAYKHARKIAIYFYCYYCLYVRIQCCYYQLLASHKCRVCRITHKGLRIASSPSPWGGGGAIPGPFIIIQQLLLFFFYYSYGSYFYCCCCCYCYRCYYYQLLVSHICRVCPITHKGLRIASLPPPWGGSGAIPGPFIIIQRCP